MHPMHATCNRETRVRRPRAAEGDVGAEGGGRTRVSLLQVACIGCIGCRWVRGVVMLAGRSGCEPACKSRVQATSSASPAGLWGRVAGAAALARVLAFSDGGRDCPMRGLPRR